MRQVYSMAVWLLILSTATAQVPKKPPPATGKVGEPVTPFLAIKAGGGSDESPAGTFVAYSTMYADNPTLVIFTREADDHLAEALTALNELIATDTTKQKRAYIVIFEKDREVNESMAKKFAARRKSPHVPIVYPNGPDPAFRSFGVSQTSDTTVVTLVGNKVHTTFTVGTLQDGSIARAVENLNRAAEKALQAAEEARHRSGLKKDETLPPYYITKLSGPDDTIPQGAGGSYRTVYNNLPHVVILLRKVDPNVVELLQQVDDTVEKQEKRKLRGWVTLLGPTDPTTKLGKEMAVKHQLYNLPITIPQDSEKGPPELKLSPEIEVTVMVANWDGKVIGNHISPKAADVDEDFVKRVVRDAMRAEPQPPPRGVKK